jgi:hypothetical protein
VRWRCCKEPRLLLCFVRGQLLIGARSNLTLRGVADEYLQCHLCRSYDTGAIESVGPPSAVEHSSASFSAERWQRRACLASGLNKDQVTRLMFIECNRCGARRSVTQVKAGFHATTKKDRKAAKGV